jgi:hypothetical protein
MLQQSKHTGLSIMDNCNTPVGNYVFSNEPKKFKRPKWYKKT